MPGELLPLFVVEEQNAKDNWRLVRLRRALFRDMVGELTCGDGDRECDCLPLRAKRVKTLEEAEILAGPLGVGGWLQNITKRILWTPIREMP